MPSRPCHPPDDHARTARTLGRTQVSDAAHAAESHMVVRRCEWTVDAGCRAACARTRNGPRKEGVRTHQRGDVDPASGSAALPLRSGTTHHRSYLSYGVALPTCDGTSRGYFALGPSSHEGRQPCRFLIYGPLHSVPPSR